MQKRGIIMAPPIEITDSGIISGKIDLKQQIRMLLFFGIK